MFNETLFAQFKLTHIIYNTKNNVDDENIRTLQQEIQTMIIYEFSFNNNVDKIKKARFYMTRSICAGGGD